MEYGDPAGCPGFQDFMNEKCRFLLMLDCGILLTEFGEFQQNLGYMDPARFLGCHALVWQTSTNVEHGDPVEFSGV